jgi:hypothetical protein
MPRTQGNRELYKREMKETCGHKWSRLFTILLRERWRRRSHTGGWKEKKKGNELLAALAQRFLKYANSPHCATP